MDDAPGTVFIVDDDESVVRATGRLLRSEGWKVATYSSPLQFLKEQDPAAPGCLILDMVMPGISGFEVQQRLQQAGNCLPIIFLTGNGDIPMSVRAMKSGAVDFLSKPCGDDELLDAIHRAFVIDRALRKRRAADLADAELFATLTPREREVMLGVVAGQVNKAIATKLGTVEKTIKVHRARVMEKLKVATLADLVRLAERAGVRTKSDMP